MEPEMTYIVLMYQGGGCDYTIGCGKISKIITCTPNELKSKCIELLDYYGCLEEGSETSLDNFEVYKLGDCLYDNRNYNKWGELYQAEIEALDECEGEKAERAELARLQEKYNAS